MLDSIYDTKTTLKSLFCGVGRKDVKILSSIRDVRFYKWHFFTFSIQSD